MDRKNHTLLVVDGSASHRFYLGTMLRRLEYTVRSANSSEDALQLMAKILPSLVVTDFALPDMNGIDLLMKMKQDQRLKTVPVIIQSADDGPGMRERCMTAGCLTYFKKPAEIDDLYRAIQEALESSPRKAVRIDTAFKVQVGDKNAPGGFVRRESITDLSDGGLFISTLTPDPVKTVLPLTLFIEDRVIEATAVVMFVSKKIEGQNQGAGMGMKFVSIDEKDRVFIRNYIKKRLSEELSV